MAIFEKNALRGHAGLSSAGCEKIASIIDGGPLSCHQDDCTGFVGSSLSPEMAVLKEFNKRYAVIRTVTTHILVEEANGGFYLDGRSSFLTYHENDFFLSSQGKPLNKAVFWLKHPARRTFQGLIFDPIQPGHHSGCFNIFNGFAVEPRPGDCGLFWRHVREVICAGRESLYTYVRRWMASVVQSPANLGTAIVLQGMQGTGKNRFVEEFGKLFGRHFLTVNNLQHLLGRFNAHLRYAYLVHANEALWAGDRSEIGTLKALISDPSMVLEGKGRDAVMIPNVRHFIISSNESCPVALDLDDRRFLVLRVSPHRKEDHNYFSQLSHQMAQGGTEALLHELLQEDLSDFSLQRMPTSPEAFDLKMACSTSVIRYIFEALQEGRWNLDERTGEWDSLPCELLFRNYCEWCRLQGLRTQSSAELGRGLHSCLQLGKTRRSCAGVRAWWYEFPSLEVARLHFQRVVKQGEEIWM